MLPRKGQFLRTLINEFNKDMVNLVQISHFYKSWRLVKQNVSLLTMLYLTGGEDELVAQQEGFILEDLRPVHAEFLSDLSESEQMIVYAIPCNCLQTLLTVNYIQLHTSHFNTNIFFESV